MLKFVSNELLYTILVSDMYRSMQFAKFIDTS